MNYLRHDSHEHAYSGTYELNTSRMVRIFSVRRDRPIQDPIWRFETYERISEFMFNRIHADDNGAATVPDVSSMELSVLDDQQSKYAYVVIEYTAYVDVPGPLVCMVATKVVERSDAARNERVNSLVAHLSSLALPVSNNKGEPLN